jgi:MshEN domain
MAPDVYRDWLGIKETERPLNYYQILRLKPFEDKTVTIRTHYRKMNVHVRKYAAGDFGPQSQELLNELAQAMLCLTDAKRKREYDATLGRTDSGDLRSRTFEEIILSDGKIDQKQLDKARHFADAVGLEMRDAVLQQKLVEPDVVMLAYAESIGLPYIELADLGVVEELIPLIPPNRARQYSFVPVMADEDQVLMASPNPLVGDVEDDLRLRLEKTIRTVICTPASINEAVAKYFPPDAPQPPTPKAGKKAKAKPKKEKKAKPEKSEDSATPEESPMTTAAQKKQQKLMAAVGFNMGIILTIMGMSLFGQPGSFSITDYLIALIAGLVMGVVGYIIGPKIS